jgi:hypothetical protein
MDITFSVSGSQSKTCILRTTAIPQTHQILWEDSGLQAACRRKVIDFWGPKSDAASIRFILFADHLMQLFAISRRFDWHFGDEKWTHSNQIFASIFMRNINSKKRKVHQGL